MVKKSIAFTESEGTPVLLDICGNFLVLATTLGTIKLYDIARAEPKQIVPVMAL